MSWFVILIFLLVFCAVLGPVLMMKPNKRQEAVANLRHQAIVSGLKVHMNQLNKQPTPVYQLQWPRQKNVHYGDSAWRLERKNYSHGIHLAGFWYWSDESRAAEPVVEVMKLALPSLPESVKAVGADGGGLCCYWIETGGEAALKAIDSWLRQTQEQLWPLVAVQDENAGSKSKPVEEESEE